MCSRTGLATGAAALRDTLANAMATYSPELLVTTTDGPPACCCSDHISYLDHNRPATHSIHRGSTQYPHYHRATDTPANMGPHARDVGRAIVRGNLAALVELAGYDLLFADDFED